MAHMQSRVGPMYAGGFHGWAQLVADGVKFVQKEDVVPAAADRTVFRLAPAVALIPYLVVLVAIPIGAGLVGADLDAGHVLRARRDGRRRARLADGRLGQRQQVLAARRACARAAQLMAYELPFVLAAASVAMAAGTLSLSGIVEAWEPWWLLWQLPGAVVFFVAGLAELQRPPFDMPVADSEIIFGAVHRVHRAAVRAVPARRVRRHRRALRADDGAVPRWLARARSRTRSAGCGRCSRPCAVPFVVIWLRVAYPRLREDQLQRLAWQGLVPAGAAAARTDRRGGGGDA